MTMTRILIYWFEYNSWVVTPRLCPCCLLWSSVKGMRVFWSRLDWNLLLSLAWSSGEFSSVLCHRLPEWTLASYLTSLCLISSPVKQEQQHTSQGCHEGKLINVCEALRYCSDRDHINSYIDRLSFLNCQVRILIFLMLWQLICELLINSV